MQWSCVEGGAAPFETLTAAQASAITTQYTMGQREVLPTVSWGGWGGWGGLGSGIQPIAQEHTPKLRKGQVLALTQSQAPDPLPENAGILRPLAEIHTTPFSRRSEHGPMLESSYSPFLTPPSPKPLGPMNSQQRVEPPHMQQKEQKVWDPAPPQFMGWGASHALPSEQTQVDRKSAR